MHTLNWLNSKWLAAGWFILMCVLFFLPGSDLPKENWFFARVHLDKWVHFGLFAILLFLCRRAFYRSSKYFALSLLLLAVLYGFTVELIQGLWIPGRSFDLFDLAADTAGSIAGLLAWGRIYKNKPL